MGSWQPRPSFTKMKRESFSNMKKTIRLLEKTIDDYVKKCEERKDSVKSNAGNVWRHGRDLSLTCQNFFFYSTTTEMHKSEGSRFWFTPLSVKIFNLTWKMFPIGCTAKPSNRWFWSTFGWTRQLKSWSFDHWMLMNKTIIIDKFRWN